MVRPARRAQAARHPARVRVQGDGQRRPAPGVDGGGGAVHERGRARSARALGRGAPALPDRLPIPGSVRRGAQAVAARGGPDQLGRRDRPLGAGGMRELEARLWTALTEVEDPEIPVSVVGLGLIVSLYYDADERVADVEL